MSILYLYMNYILDSSDGGIDMKTALIVGITGNFGSYMARALHQRGWSIKVLMRNADKAPDWLEPANIIVGNAINKADVSRAAQGTSLLVYAANPQYHRWNEEAMQMLEPSVAVAEKMGLRVLFPGNVYSFSPTDGLIHEGAEQIPRTDKGVIRQKMERRLKTASLNGAKVTIVRAGDFLAPEMQLSWLDFMLKQKRQHMQVSMPHNQTHVHYWTYLPDLCANTALLLEQTEDSFEVWHDPGLALETADWQKAFRDHGVNTKFGQLPWAVFKVIGLFNPMLKEVLKMRYLWREPVVLDGTKMRNALQDQLQSTSLKGIVGAVLDSRRAVNLELAKS